MDQSIYAISSAAAPDHPTRRQRKGERPTEQLTFEDDATPTPSPVAPEQDQAIAEVGYRLCDEGSFKKVSTARGFSDFSLTISGKYHDPALEALHAQYESEQQDSTDGATPAAHIAPADTGDDMALGFAIMKHLGPLALVGGKMSPHDAFVLGWKAKSTADIASKPNAEPVELAGIAEQMKRGAGFWHTCSGCHETEDGHAVGRYDYSQTMMCALGTGCSECGGIGAVWDNNDYGALGGDWDKPEAATPAASAPTVPEGHVIVPMKITEDMHAAAVRAIVRATGNDDFPPSVWAAMLTAAPFPPVVQPFAPSASADAVIEVREQAAERARNDVLEEAAVECERVESDKFDQYKGRGIHAPNNPHRADTYTNGESDGAGICAFRIRAMMRNPALKRTQATKGE